VTIRVEAGLVSGPPISSRCDGCGYTMEGTNVVPLMLGHLYAALRSANVSDEHARAAAEEVASFESRIGRIERDLLVIKWMLGTLTALNLGNLWLSFSILGRLPR
jgi:hypothetical protein